MLPSVVRQGKARLERVAVWQSRWSFNDLDHMRAPRHISHLMLKYVIFHFIFNLAALINRHLCRSADNYDWMKFFSLHLRRTHAIPVIKIATRK